MYIKSLPSVIHHNANHTRPECESHKGTCHSGVEILMYVQYIIRYEFPSECTQVWIYWRKSLVSPLKLAVIAACPVLL